jgi:hypothetical protein
VYKAVVVGSSLVCLTIAFDTLRKNGTYPNEFGSFQKIQGYKEIIT